MSFLEKLGNILPGSKAASSQPVNYGPVEDFKVIGYNNITLYPANTGKTYITQGYNRNDAVYSIVSKNARKFAQVPFYHYRIKNNEKSTWREYLRLTKQGITPENIFELKKMRHKSIDEVKVDSVLSKLLAKPNRNQTGALFLEQAYGFKQLSGEGNLWLNKGKDGKQIPSEMFIIPKGNLQLKTGSDIWTVSGYQLTFGGLRIDAATEQVIMWIYPNYEEPHPATLAHLRGQSPLDAGRLVLQGSNVGNERLVKMNENQGAAGLAYRTDAHDNPTVQQAQATRDQFNNAVNSKDMAGAIAIMAGQWGYLQFGLDAQKLQLLEQGDKAFEKLCNVLSTPPSIFKTDQTYENQRESKRNWVYDNIAPAAYSFRDELNEKLILQMGLDRDRDFIDCDILGLPEMAIDMKAQIETYSKAWWFTPNQILKKLGEDESSDPNMNKVYAPSSVVPLDELNVQIGSNLDSEMNLLNDQSAQA